MAVRRVLKYIQLCTVLVYNYSYINNSVFSENALFQCAFGVLQS